jgi:hypothetical protein
MSTHPSFSIEDASKLVGKAVEVKLKDGVRIAALSEFIFHSGTKTETQLPVSRNF